MYKKTIGAFCGALFFVGCANSTTSVAEVDATNKPITMEEKVKLQEAEITRLNSQVDLMGKNLAFLNKKVKEQEDALKGGATVQDRGIPLETGQDVITLDTSHNQQSGQPVNGNLVKFQPSTFKVTSPAIIINRDGKQMGQWEAGRHFTSYSRVGEYLVISGYSAPGRPWAKTTSEVFISNAQVQRVQ